MSPPFLNSLLESAFAWALQTSLEFRAQGYKTQAEMLEKALIEAKRTDIDNVKKYRPYYTAKRDLETSRAIREAVKMKLMAEKLAKDI